ncbi:MAG: phospho-N-acetylmuramoyl-pentapeptide-transferase [Bacillota bacterium]
MSGQIISGTVVGIAAFIFSVIIAPGLIRFFRYLKYGQTVRDDGPASHKAKAGVPTMGGIIFLTGAILGLVVRNRWSGPMAALVVLILGFALIGLLDDLIIVVRKRPLGLKARYKLLIQIILASAFAVYLYTHPQTTAGMTWRVPFSHLEWNLPPWLFFPLTVFVLVGSVNAVNLSDGLDGLAIGTSGISLMVLAILCFWSGYSDLLYVSLALAGACLGFAWFNAHPAQVFMGDTGALALGGALGGLALMSGNILFLPIFGGIFVAETLSVVIQVVMFRLTGQRWLKMSPLHHHFELSGWDEPKVVIRFWIAGLILGLLGLLGYIRF